MTSQLPVTAAKWQAVFPSGPQVASALAPRSRQLCAINLYYIAACELLEFLCENGSLEFLMVSLTGSKKISRFIVKYSTTVFSHNYPFTIALLFLIRLYTTLEFGNQISPSDV